MKDTRGLWRGKQKYNGEWIVGDRRYITDLDGSYYPCIVDNSNGRNNSVSGVPVDPSTLGECTGSNYKDGNLAFEGDLIHNFSSIGVIKYGEYRQPFNDDEYTKHIGFYVYWLEEKDKRTLRADLGYWLEFVDVIGNIHDSPISKDFIPFWARTVSNFRDESEDMINDNE